MVHLEVFARQYPREMSAGSVNLLESLLSSF